MLHGGRRPYKLYTWWKRYSKTPTRSFKTEEAAIAAFEVLDRKDRDNTDVWYEANKQIPKRFIISMGERRRD